MQLQDKQDINWWVRGSVTLQSILVTISFLGFIGVFLSNVHRRITKHKLRSRSLSILQTHIIQDASDHPVSAVFRWTMKQLLLLNNTWHGLCSYLKFLSFTWMLLLVNCFRKLKYHPYILYVGYGYKFFANKWYPIVIEKKYWYGWSDASCSFGVQTHEEFPEIWKLERSRTSVNSVSLNWRSYQHRFVVNVVCTKNFV